MISRRYLNTHNIGFIIESLFLININVAPQITESETHRALSLRHDGHHLSLVLMVEMNIQIRQPGRSEQ